MKCFNLIRIIRKIKLLIKLWWWTNELHKEGEKVNKKVGNYGYYKKWKK